MPSPSEPLSAALRALRDRNGMYGADGGMWMEVDAGEYDALASRAETMEAELAAHKAELNRRNQTTLAAELAEARHAARGLEGELAEARAEVERAVNWRGTAEAAAINAIS